MIGGVVEDKDNELFPTDYKFVRRKNQLYKPEKTYAEYEDDFPPLIRAYREDEKNRPQKTIRQSQISKSASLSKLRRIYRMRQIMETIPEPTPSRVEICMKLDTFLEEKYMKELHRRMEGSTTMLCRHRLFPKPHKERKPLDLTPLVDQEFFDKPIEHSFVEKVNKEEWRELLLRCSHEFVLRKETVIFGDAWVSITSLTIMRPTSHNEQTIRAINATKSVKRGNKTSTSNKKS